MDVAVRFHQFDSDLIDSPGFAHDMNINKIAFYDSWMAVYRAEGLC